MSERIKCTRCKVAYPTEGFKAKKNGDLHKHCINCTKKQAEYRQKNKCEHNRRKNRCKDCGVGYCEHGRLEGQCKDCGTGYCDHGKQKNQCNDCGTGYCEHNKRKYKCKECGTGQCEHGKFKNMCKDCGIGYCDHGKQKNKCKECKDPIKITINKIISNSREADKKYNRYDANNFIDKCFIKGLIEDYKFCYYSDCKTEMQYIDYTDNLATIERLDNSIGHIKSNCVLCCLKCNHMKKSNRPADA